MNRSLSHFLGLFTAGLAWFLASCESNSVAGKTTTTTNGGTVVALGPEGQPLPGCVLLAARQWDIPTSKPAWVDTAFGDSAGIIQLPQEAYAFLEIRNAAKGLGAWSKRIFIQEGDRQTIHLDTLREIHGHWTEGSGTAEGRMLLDSTFHSALLEANGSFSFTGIPKAKYSLVFDADTGALRPLGTVILEDGITRFEGNGNVTLTSDTTVPPLWIDDFESGTTLPMLFQSQPAMSPWYTWTTQMEMTLPVSSQETDMLQAMGPDSTRNGKVFHARFTGTGDFGWFALGLTGLALDISAYSKVCFSYRTDTLLYVVFQRDSVSGVRPALSSTLPSSLQWRNACLATASMTPDPETPDSLVTWKVFGRKVLAIEFQIPIGGTFVDLDDIVFR